MAQSTRTVTSLLKHLLFVDNVLCLAVCQLDQYLHTICSKLHVTKQKTQIKCNRCIQCLAAVRKGMAAKSREETVCPQSEKTDLYQTTHTLINKNSFLTFPNRKFSMVNVQHGGRELTLHRRLSDKNIQNENNV